MEFYWLFLGALLLLLDDFLRKSAVHVYTTIFYSLLSFITLVFPDRWFSHLLLSLSICLDFSIPIHLRRYPRLRLFCKQGRANEPQTAITMTMVRIRLEGVRLLRCFIQVTSVKLISLNSLSSVSPSVSLGH
ncbi:hypothetical protein BJV82DRAFT_584897 [Fennellomyces sp. T-0311]|nr:hypothetical protein BJV82DRAFT_584897 [Fennellomyces sp. T-0311]